MNLQQLRTTALSDTEIQATKQRFALFSQPPPLAIGDDSPFKTRLHPKGQDGKPVTVPRNFVTNPNRSGVLKSTYFQQPESIYKGDLYVDPYLKKLQEQNKKYKEGKFHQTEFVPASGFKTLATPAYKYQEEKTDTSVKKIMRDQNGRVKTESRNCQTNPCSMVETKLLKFPSHMSDPYNRKKQLDAEHQKKMIAKRGEAPFRSMSHGHRLFNKNSIIYGTDVKFPAKKNMTAKFNIVNHESVFRPANISRGPLNKFPQFKPESPIIKTPRKRATVPEVQKKEVFKPNRGSLSRPTPTIAYNPVILRRSLNK